jgi:hypothetical protein
MEHGCLLDQSLGDVRGAQPATGTPRPVVVNIDGVVCSTLLEHQACRRARIDNGVYLDAFRSQFAADSVTQAVSADPTNPGRSRA